MEQRRQETGSVLLYDVPASEATRMVVKVDVSSGVPSVPSGCSSCDHSKLQQLQLQQLQQRQQRRASCHWCRCCRWWASPPLHEPTTLSRLWPPPQTRTARPGQWSGGPEETCNEVDELNESQTVLDSALVEGSFLTVCLFACLPVASRLCRV